MNRFLCIRIMLRIEAYVIGSISTWEKTKRKRHGYKNDYMILYMMHAFCAYEV